MQLGAVLEGLRVRAHARFERVGRDDLLGVKRDRLDRLGRRTATTTLATRTALAGRIGLAWWFA